MKKTGEIKSLTGLRGISSLTVAFYHTGFAHPWWIAMWTFPDAAVDFFFVLSGFCLCLAYKVQDGGRLDLLRYLKARFARVYPLHALSLFIMWWLIFRHLGGSGYYPNPRYWQDAIRNIFMINSWPLIGTGTNWDLPAWSLSGEVFCYIFLFPVFAWFYTSLTRIPAILRFALAYASCYGGVFMFTRHWDTYLGTIPPFHKFLPIAYWAPLVCAVTMFASGCLIYSFYCKGEKFISWCARYLDYIALLALIYLLACTFMSWQEESLAMFGPILILGLAKSETSYFARMLGSGPIYWLGCVSYSIYLLHIPVNYELHHLWPSVADYYVTNLLATFFFLLLAASASYYLFEMPLRDLIKSIRFKKTAVASS